jgi:large repetitive protein
MLKRMFNIPVLLVVFMLIYQLIVPIGSIRASANSGTMLPPSNLAYQSITPDDGKLTWSAVFGASGYQIYEIKDGQLTVLGTTTGTSYDLKDLPEGSYRYVVSTLSSQGESGPSAPVSTEISYPEMQTPAAFAATIQNGNDVVLSWGASQYAEKYNIYQVLENGEKSLVTSTNTLTYHFSNVAEGTYSYAISSIHPLYGESVTSTPFNVNVVKPVMKAPTNLSFTIANVTDVTLKWQAAEFANSYSVYSVKNGQLELIDTVTSTNVTFKNLPAGDYVYQVYSNSSRFGSSVEGSEVTFSVQSIEMIPPENVNAKIQNTNDVVVSWTSAPYATGYKVYQVVEGEKVLKGTVTGTSFSASMLAGGDYVYEVHSISDRFGESEKGTQVTFTIETVKVNPPTELAYKIQNGNDIVLSWKVAENATNYKVYQLVGDQKILKSTVTGTTVTYSNMPAGNYKYEVHTNSTRFGESGEGAKMSFVLDQVVVATPGNARYEISNGNDLKLQWDSVEFANSYKVYQVVDGNKVLKTTVSSLSTTLSNLPAGGYKYEIYAYSSRFGESPVGAVVELTLVHPEMKAPANGSYTITGPAAYTLKWDAVDYANSYKIYQVVDGNKTLKNTITGTSMTYSNMAPGEYQYEIYSYSSRFGESKVGTSIKFTLSGLKLATPENPSYTISNGNDITLKWNAVQYANNYNIYQLINGEEVLLKTVTVTSTTLTNVAEGPFQYIIKGNSTLFGESPEGAVLEGNLVHPDLAKPGNANYTVSNGNEITLKWDAVQYANGYQIYQVIDGEKQFVRKLTGTTINFSNMPEGDYQYIVHSYSDRFGESPEGSELAFTLVHPVMQAPANLTKTFVNVNDIKLSWDASPFATEYRIYLLKDGELTLQKTLTGLTHTFVNMPEGDYEYIVHSYSSRFGESPEGSKLVFTLVHPVMQAPANLTKTILNGNDIKLSWDASTYATSYKVYQKVGGELTLLSTLPATTRTIAYTNMPEGDYEYVVHAYSTRFGESPEGSELVFTLVHPVMQAPANLTKTFVNVNDIKLSWDASPFATEYRIYLLKDGELTLQKTLTGLTHTFVNMPEGDYEYIVHSYSSRFGESPEGSKLVFTLVHPVMQAPANLTKTILNGNDIKLSWDASTYATSYKVYQKVDGELTLLSTLPATTRTIAYTNMPEGDYEYVVHSYSTRFGESPEGSELVFTLVHPVMQAPANPTKVILNGNDIKLSWDASTYATSYKVYQKVDGELTLLNTLPATTRTIAFTNMPEGDYEYVVHSYSDRFGESPEGSELVFTLVHPVMQAPANLTKAILNGNDIKLNWDASTYATSYKVYQKVDGELKLLSTLPTTTRTITFTNMPEGVYEYVVHSYSNRFGESPEGSELVFTMVHPVMEAPADLTKTILNENYIKLSWAASTYATSYKVYQKVDGELKLLNTLPASTRTITYTNMPEGDYEYVVHSYSTRFGESPEGRTLTFTLTWPVVQAPVVSNRVENVNNFTLSWQAVTWANEYRVYKVTDSGKELIYKGTGFTHKVYNLPEGVHSYEVTAFSSRFGESEPSNMIIEKVVFPIMGVPAASLKLLSDTSARITWDFVTYANGYNIYEVINGEPVLVAEKINNLSYTINNLTYANHWYYVTSYSNSFGESKPSETVLAKLIIDEEAPVTTVNAPTDWVNQDQLVEFTATDNEVGVAHTYYSLNDGPIVEGTSVLVANEGINKIVYNSIDKVGNLEEVKTALVKIDKTAPTTEVNEIPTASQSFTVELTASDELSGVLKTYYSLNGSEYVEGTSIEVTEEGVNKISYYSIDAAGNKEAVKTVEVNIDQTAPITTADLPTTWVKEAVNVKLVASDENSGVKTTYYSINGSDYVEGTSLLVDKEGINTISYYSVDIAGNKEDVKTAEVKLDKTVPITVSDVSEKWSKEPVVVSLASEDKHSGVAVIYYSVNGSEYMEGSTFTVDKEGVNSVSYYSVDAAGNVEEVKSIEVKIDKTAPTLLLDVKGEYELGETVTLNYLADDNLSGIAVEEVTFNGQTYKKEDQVSLDQPGEYKFSVKVTDAAGWSTVVQKTIVVYIPVSLEVLPRVINGNKGIFTVKATLPKEFQAYTFNVSSVTLDDVSPVTDNNGLYKQAEKGHFKFERSDFTWTPGEAQLELRGYVGKYLVVGKAIATVKK